MTLSQNASIAQLQATFPMDGFGGTRTTQHRIATFAMAVHWCFVGSPSSLKRASGPWGLQIPVAGFPVPFQNKDRESGEGASLFRLLGESKEAERAGVSEAEGTDAGLFIS